VVKKRNVGRLLKSGCNEEENEILKLLFKTYQKGVMPPNFRKLVFSVFLSIVLPLAGFFTFANYSTPTLQYVYLLLYVLFVGVSFILVLEIIDCSLMMILSLGKAELGM
jgi:hypothetical protein